MIGAAAGDGKGRILGAALGAALGGILGGAIGRHLDEQDRVRVAEATRVAAITGRDQSWTGDKSGARGTVRVASSEQRKATVRVATAKDRIERMPPIDLINDAFEVTRRVNVRSGPGTDYKIVDTLAAGEQVQVVGKVQNADWYVIARNGVADGFVAEGFLRPASQPMPTRVASQPAADTQVVEVEARQTCRIVVHEVELADGRSQQERMRVCPGPNGWEIQAA